MKSKVRLTSFKGEADDSNALVLLLAAYLHKNSMSISLSNADLEAVEGKVGIRAKFEEDGGITAWTYPRILGES